MGPICRHRLLHGSCNQEQVAELLCAAESGDLSQVEEMLQVWTAWV